MKVGLQTICWGDCNGLFEGLLLDIKALGYEGIELAHVVPREKHNELAEKFCLSGISLTGVACGSVSDRIELAQSFSKYFLEQSFYIYADEWSAREHELYVESALSCNVAVHPHMFKPIQTFAEAKAVLAKHTYARFLPDTAHMTVAGDNVLDVLQQNLHSVVAVHLKDWSPEYGRALPFYSAGFVSLGAGVVPISRVVDLLVRKAYKGWLIVEQDFAADPLRAAEESREFLRKLGV